MKALSEAQYLAATTGGMPEPELIGEGLWSLPMAMPGEFLSYTLSVVHLDAKGAVTIVDPGWASDAALERIEEFLGSLGRSMRDVRTVVVTHSHPDHIGLAESLREATGAALLLSRREQAALDAFSAPTPEETTARLDDWGVDPSVAEAIVARVGGRAVPPAPRADVLLGDGDGIDGTPWRALLTPGHTAGHLCLVDDERRLLFSGDHVLPTVFPGLGLGARLDTNPLADYLDSLARLEPYDEYQVVPGHGYRFTGLHGRRTDAARHALRRAREVDAILAREPDASVWEMAPQLTWTGGWDRLSTSPMLFSGLLQTDMYREFVQSGALEAHRHE